MKQIELIEKRKPREKHFLQKDGTIIAKIYSDDIHFLKDGKYEEIDNSLIESSQYYSNKSNSYNVFFDKKSKNKLFKIEKQEHFLDFSIKNEKENKYNSIKMNSNIKNRIKYENILDNIDLEYKILNNKVKESIVLKSKEAIFEKIEFEVLTNLELILNDDGSISALKNGDVEFQIDAPYMVDDNEQISDKVNYILKKASNKYFLEVSLDKEWLNNNERKYPVIVDPTISTTTNNNNVYDTYINSSNPNFNYNAYDRLSVGAELYEGDVTPTIYRSLIKFDLPQLPTSSEIVNAELNLTGYVVDWYYITPLKRIIEVHRVTSPWNETTANWNNMNNNYDSRVETCFYGGCSYYSGTDEISWENHYANITNLVKKWYIDNENYGLMLKTSDESGVSTESGIDFTPKFFSNANEVIGDNPQPALIITYKDHNGLENYMEYFTQDFSVGRVSVNSYNGNLVGLFNLVSFKTGNIPTSLNIVYNTNDVVTNLNNGYGLGWRLNLAQTITYIPSDDMLTYVDFDGTTHYFNNSKIIRNANGQEVTIQNQDEYYDEDGLDFVIKSYTSKYELKDKDGTILEFTKQNNNIALLTKIIDTDGNYINIYYNNGKIYKLSDSYNRDIDLIYDGNSIIVSSPDKEITLNISNNKLTSIVYYSTSLYNSTLNFNYNNHNILSSVQYDVYKCVNYEYYDKSPYKVKKVIDSNGDYFSISYNNSSTTVTDNLGKIFTYTFNNLGSVKSISNLKSQDFVKSALGRNQEYGETYQEKNKLLSMGKLIGYINNYLTNTSFENDENIFTSESGISSNIVNECSQSGKKSLKITTTQANKNIYKELNVEKGNDYTFSAYVKNSTVSNIKFTLEYDDSNSDTVTSSTVINRINSEFTRYDVSINYPSNSSSNLILRIGAENICSFYIDDIQLEEGNVANPFNYIDNSDFSNGTTGWTKDATNVIGNQTINENDIFQVITLADNSNALKIKMSPLYSTGIHRNLNISGVAGDNYTLSFWYKNKGITHDENLTYNTCLVSFVYENGQGSFPTFNLNPNCEEWQFFSYTFYAEHDYTSLSISLFQMFDANDLYITNFSLLKNIKKSKLTYDEKGNVLSVKAFDDNTTSFNYDKDNKLIQMFDVVGNNLSFEYDELLSNRIINGISDSGISNEVKYNEQKLPYLTSVSNKIVVGLQDGTYKIRLSGTDRYLNVVEKMLSLSSLKDFETRWLFETVVIADKTYYKIKHAIIDNSYISNISSTVGLDDYNINNSLFELIKNNNRSYYIKLYNSEKYIMANNDSIVFSDFNSDFPEKFEFYIEKFNNIKFIENTGTYLESGLAIKTITNTSLNNVCYDYDVDTGKIISFTNADNISTYYSYDKITNSLLSVHTGEKTIRYIYDDYGLLSTINYIVSGEILKSYFYNYDAKKRLLSVNVGNLHYSYPLYTNTYDNITGELISTRYSNNMIISYEYDNMSRICKITTDDNEYKYYYYKDGNVGKVLSNNEVYKYIYDSEDMIKKYIFNNFIVDYVYNKQLEKISNISYNLDNLNYSINYDYGTDSMLKTIYNNNGSYEYIYDDIGRLSGQKINNNLYTQYSFIDNGKRTTTKIKSVVNGTDQYTYKYDKLDNVTHIYHNDKLEKRYTYDKFNQLVREDNYNKNITIRYKYNSSGNIISKKEFNLNSYEIINLHNYNYQMTSNCDVLTSVDDNTSLSYDDCFNPTSIGANITMNWKNRNQLSIYNDVSKNLNIHYSYDKDGIRTKKTINNVSTEFYWENGRLIIEKSNDKILYFIYDASNSLLGFEYNGTRYSYIKNGLQEIIGIIDSNNTIIAKYEYDSWGKLLSIYDGNDNDVSQNNNHIANINPFRYKSYYFDKETNLYYLKNRYYNPEWCRFINPDETLNNDIFGTNPYIYCSNNPIKRKDDNGEFWFAVGVAVTGALVGMAVNTVSNLAQGKKWNEGIAGAAVGGAVGALVDVYCAGVPKIIGAVAVAAAESVTNELLSYASIDVNLSNRKNSKTPVVSVTQKKELSSKNLYDSYVNVVTDVAIGAATAGISNKLHVEKFTNKIAYFNKGWYKPQKFASVFGGKYMLKRAMNSLVKESFDEVISVLLTPSELSDSQVGENQCPVIVNTCPPLENQCPLIN